jgi:lipopolysaccharide assembly outer membrane protein LptD (OstA)
LSANVSGSGQTSIFNEMTTGGFTMLTNPMRQALALSTTLMITYVPAFSQASTPTAEKGYKLSVFATSVPGQYTKPDSIAVFENHVYIAYGDGNDPTGGDGKSNMVIEYTRTG